MPLNSIHIIITPMKKIKFLTILAFIFTLISCNNSDNFKSGFKNPAPEYKPYTWWRWLGGNSSKEGITKDLEAIADIGIGGFSFFDLGDYYPKEQIKFGSPEYYDYLSYTIKECNRLGLNFSFQNCDGWSTSGGPWITPDLAMKKITSSKIPVHGGCLFDGQLPMPDTILGYFKELAVFAIPQAIKKYAMIEANPVISTDYTVTNSVYYSMFQELYNTGSFSFHPLTNLGRFADGDNVSPIRITMDKNHGWGNFVQYAFRKPFTASSLYIAGHIRYHPRRLVVQTSDDGKSFVSRTDTIKNLNEKCTVIFPAITSRYFRIVFLEYAGISYYQKHIEINEALLLAPGEEFDDIPITGWEEKSGLWHYYDESKVLSEPDYFKDNKAFLADKLIDVTSVTDKNGHLKWAVPEGDWTILRVGYTLTGSINRPATSQGVGLESDKMDVGAIRSFFNGYCQKMIDANKNYIGKGLYAVLRDSYEQDIQNWTDSFATEFKRRRGYDITPWLPVLCGYAINNIDESERFLWDFRKTISELFARNYAEMERLCAKNNLPFIGQLANSWGTPLSDGITYASKADIPMAEKWSNKEPGEKSVLEDELTIKDVVSAGHLYNKPILDCETFTCIQGNWRHHPFALKADADQVLCMGLNRITIHVFMHQPDETLPEWAPSNWGINSNRKLTFWKYEKDWIKYLTRCQYMNRQGTQVVDALVFAGDGSPATIVKSYKTDPFKLLPKGYDYDGCNLEKLLTADVCNGKVILENGLSYQVLILPPANSMSLLVASKIRELVNKGAVIYGLKPEHSSGLFNYQKTEKEVKNIADEVWGNVSRDKLCDHNYGKGRVLFCKNFMAMFKKLQIDPDFSYPDTAANLLYIHRKFNNIDYYFLSNQESKPVQMECAFRITGKQPEFWFAENGSTSDVPEYKITSGYTTIPIRLEPRGSLYVVFDKEIKGSHIETVLINGNKFTDWIKENSGNKMPAYKIVRANEKLIGEFYSRGEYIFKINEKLIKMKVEVPGPIEIKGPWNLKFTPGWGVCENVTFDSLICWNKCTDFNICHYSGAATYSNIIQIGKEMLTNNNKFILDLDKVYNMAVVKINCSDSITVWEEPYCTDITDCLKAGENKLEITVINSWANRIIGDLNLPESQRKTSIKNFPVYKKDSPLVESGLEGNVKIHVIVCREIKP